MLECPDICVKSTSFEFATGANRALFDTTRDPQLAACVVCDAPGMYACYSCYCVVYCGKVCRLKDYERHEHECEMHSPRLWSYRRFERFAAQSVRFKHTGDPVLGVGMFARQAFAPGARILEDCVQFTSQMITDALQSKDYSDFYYIESFLEAIYGDKGFSDPDLFARHSNQITGITGGYQGSWTSLINHSCSPNAVMMVSDCKRYILITAIRSIARGEEVTLAYSGVAYAPKNIRTPLLTQLLGHPCVCRACKTPSKEEHARHVVWSVIQHSRAAFHSDMFVLSKRSTATSVISIADRVLHVAQNLLGEVPEYSSPWMSVVACSVVEYLNRACKMIKSVQLHSYKNRCSEQTKILSSQVGVCARLLLKK